MAPSKEKIGVAVVGLGIGAEHARAYLAAKNCELYWLYDLDVAKARSLVEKLGAGMAAAKFEDILNDPAVDLVSICSFDDAHGREVITALNAGKHVFVEKPLCQSVAELRAIKKVWHEKSKIHLASNLVLRSSPLFLWLKEAISRGDLGDIYAIDGDYLYGRIHMITKGWRKDVENYSVMLGGGVHMVDLMLWLSGEKPVEVHAFGNRISTGDSAFRYNDFVAATYKFSSGLVGRITANFGSVHRHQYVLRIFGTKATFIYDDMGARLHTNRDPELSRDELESMPRPQVAPAKVLDFKVEPASKSELIPGFLSAIQNGENNRAATQHEFDVISACLAADQSVADSKPVIIDYV